MGTSYTCAMYVHLRDSTRFLLVCENDPLPLLLDPRSWRLVAHGVEPPDRAKPWLKMNRYYQIHHFPDEVS